MKSAALRHPARLAGASLLRLQSDARLAELAVAGHAAAFDAIVDRYRTPLLRYCTGIVGPSRAEDAVQQTLINAHEAMTRTDEVRHLKSWLYRIAHNASLNVLRAVRDDVPLDEATLGARAGSGAADPGESFARTEQFRETLAALHALPERQRAALVLRELEGRSHEEIAAALGVTKGSARQHLMRARVAVRSAVTAVTPYPLIARLAELLSGGSSAGWVDAAAGAGAGATLMKLGAGVAATGALVGGAVGTQHVMRGGSTEAAVPHAIERSAEPVARRASAVAAAPVRQTLGAVRVKRVSSPGSGVGAPGRAGARKRKRARSHAPAPAPAPVVAPSVPSAPAATGPAVEPATPHRGRDDAEAGHGQRGDRSRGHGSDDQANRRSDDAPGGRGEHGSRRGNGDRKQNGKADDGNEHGRTPPSAPSSGRNEDGKDDPTSPSPTTDDQPTSGSKSASGSDDSGDTTSPTTPTTSTTPATTTSGDDG